MSRPNPLISNLKANKMISKGLLYHLVSVNDLDHEIPSMDSVPVVNEFLDVFLEYLRGVPPLGEIDFGIDLEPDTKPIPVPHSAEHIPLGHSIVVCKEERWDP